MADLIIKPNSATGDKLILQDRAGGAVMTTADSGATIANATLTSPTLNSPTLVTPALGTPASGVLTNATFPAGHTVDEKISIFSADASNYIATTATSWTGTSSHLNVTLAMKNASNMLLFTIMSSRIYLSANGLFFLMGVGFSNALGTNIIDLSGESPSTTQHANGKLGNVYSISGNTLQTAWQYIAKYMPGTTASKTYQPIWYSSGSGDVQLVPNNDAAWCAFHVREIQQ
jgi:hypothetical protein